MTQPILPWQSIQYEPDLSEQDKELRDAVVKEYIFDRNWLNACKRLGMSQLLAAEYAQRFAMDPYCIKRLKDIEQDIAHTPIQSKKRLEEELRQRLITQLEEQASYYGPVSSHAARVAAIKQLCLMYGFEAPKQTNVNVGVQSGVMLVPMTGSMGDWEKAASESQKKLQEETMNGIADSGTVH